MTKRPMKRATADEPSEEATRRANAEANRQLELARQERRGRVTAEAGDYVKQDARPLAQPTPKQKKPATPTPSDDADALTNTYLDLDS